eukprot:1359345-Amorphochlora_amoeboformis.AAC.1
MDAYFYVRFDSHPYPPLPPGRAYDTPSLQIYLRFEKISKIHPPLALVAIPRTARIDGIGIQSALGSEYVTRQSDYVTKQGDIS